MKLVRLPSGEEVPALGQGTWAMGEDEARRGQEADALRLGFDLGMTLVDTAEMYGEGGAEEVVREAVKGRRDDIFVVSKVYPHNATRQGAIDACERSLGRLGTDRIDLYLLHWRGGVPLAETVEAFGALVRDGKVRYWGVSNFDGGDLDELWSLDDGAACATNQVLYNLRRRGVEWDVLARCRERGVPVMAYSPLEQARLPKKKGLKAVAGRHGVSPNQVALAWTLRHDHVISIPKAVGPEHVRENVAALDLRLGAEDLAELDRAFPPPRGAQPLESL